VGETLHLPLPLQFSLAIHFLVLLEIAEHCFFIESLKLRQKNRGFILLQQLETDFLAHVRPPSHVFCHRREIGYVRLRRQHGGVDFENFEDEDGGGQFERNLFLLAEEVVEALVEVVEKLFLGEPLGGDGLVVGPEDDIREDVAHVNARRFVETSRQDLEAEFSDPGIRLQSLQIGSASRGRQGLCGEFAKQPIIAFLVELSDELEDLAVDHAEHFKSLCGVEAQKVHLEEDKVDLNSSIVPVFPAF